MVDAGTARAVTFQLLFAGVCVLIIFIKMLPLSMEPSRIPMPDLLFCFAAAFILRRPREVSPVMIVVIFLLADFLFLRPVGLWPAIVLLALEFLRNHATSSAELLLSVEIMMVPTVFAAATVINALVFLALGIPHPSFGQTSLIVLVTSVVYPAVILTTVFVLGVRRRRPSEI